MRAMEQQSAQFKLCAARRIHSWMNFENAHSSRFHMSMQWSAGRFDTPVGYLTGLPSAVQPKEHHKKLSMDIPTLASLYLSVLW